MSPRLVRTARAMLGLSQQELARLCLISWTSLNAYERERARLSGRTRRAIMESLQARGVIFLLEDRKGVGVRLARRDGLRPGQGAAQASSQASALSMGLASLS